MKTKLHYVFTFAVVLIGFSVFGQSKVWQKSASNGSLNAIPISQLDAKNYEIFTLDFNAFKQSLVNAPMRDAVTQPSNVIVEVPNEQGQMESFRLLEAPVFDADLSAQYPNIKSYVGIATDRSGARLRMSVSPQGVQTMISYLDKPMVFMQPVTGDPENYIVYNRASRGDESTGDFHCATIDEYSKHIDDTSSLVSRDANDQLLRKFRLAMSCNGEYTTFHGGTVAGALAAINASITRVNETFETDMAVTFIVIDAPELIFTNAATDPYSNNLGQWNAQLQNTLNNTIGNAAYDIGHMFGASGGGGNAGCIGCVCVNNQKGSGITSPADGIPQGDNFDVDYVAHEIGHQMGANHTFAFQTEGTGVNAEPGSGSTIMAYAGIVSGSNVQQHSDPYFHYWSIKQILDNLVTRTCWQANSPQAITNNPPVANAGSDYTIPKGTAYVLTGSATDADGGDTLMYCWEQTDSGQVSGSSFGPTNTAGPMSRSLNPTTSPMRYLPKLDRVVAGQLTQTSPAINSAWETVSNVGRNLNYALTVRDRQATATGLNGQTSYDLMRVTVNAASGPFVVTSQPPTEIWSPGESKTVTWDVASTTAAPVSTANVNILLSTDGGYTYPVTLVANTPNDGSQAVTVPTIPSATDMARVKVESVGNIFYAISASNFSITSTEPDFFISSNNDNQTACGVDAVTYDFEYTQVNGFSETTTFSATGNPAGSSVVFSPTSLNADGFYTMTVSGLNGVAVGTYTITVTGTSASLTKSTDVTLTKINGGCASVANTTFQTSTTLVVFNTINNPSGKPSGYSDYTAMSTDVNRGSSYDLTVNANTDGNYRTQTKVWIDWNQNCSFNDAGEEYDLGEAINTANGPTAGSPFSVVVPAGAVLGSTTMRVSTRYTPGSNISYPTACENDADGEVEDYSVVVMPTLSVAEFDASSFVIFPNPNHGEFTIKLNSASNSDIKVEVYDIRGRSIFNNSYNNTADFNQTIKLNHVQSGMYLVKVSDGLKQTTKKIVIE